MTSPLRPVAEYAQAIYDGVTRMIRGQMDMILTAIPPPMIVMDMTHPLCTPPAASVFVNVQDRE